MLPIRDHAPSTRVPIVTIGIIALNTWVFSQELAAGRHLDTFIARWALIPALVDVGRPTSLIPFVTSLFLHAGFAHILFNMWYLWIFGDNVEGRLGHGMYLLFYLLGGIIAGLVQFFFLAGSVIPTLGASGAVAAVLGAYWVWFPHHRVDTLVPVFGFFSRMTLPAGFVLFFWFVSQLFNGVGSLAIGSATIGGVAWWAHVGGFGFGWLVARLAGGRRDDARGADVSEPEVTDRWK